MLEQLQDLDEFVAGLRKLGLESCHEYVYSAHGCVEGVDVGDDFFPLWELQLPHNLEALQQLDFAAIKSRRLGDWSLERPPRNRQ